MQVMVNESNCLYFSKSAHNAFFGECFCGPETSFLRCTVLFPIKEVCALSLVPSLLVLLLKVFLGLLQDL